MSYVDKIDISQRQLKYLHKQFKELLDDKVKEALPETSDNDHLSQEVQVQLDQFLMDTMDIAGNSIIINDASPETTVRTIIKEVRKEYMEPFDIELNEKLRKLYQEWEDETVGVSKLRRDGPQAVLSEYGKEEQDLLKKIDSEIESAADSSSNTFNNPSDDSINFTEEERLKDQDFWHSIGMSYADILENLKQVNESLPSHELKHGRLRMLLEYLGKEVGIEQ